MVFASNTDENDVGNEIGGAIMLTGVLGVLFAVPFALSARDGYEKVDACRDAKARAMPYYPPVYAPPPQPYYPPPG